MPGRRGLQEQLGRDGAATRGTDDDGRPDPARTSNWGIRRLRVRTFILLVVLLPMIATIVVVSRSAASRWAYRSQAGVVQNDVRSIDGATTSCINFDNWVYSAGGIAYAWDKIHLAPQQVQGAIGVDFTTLLPQDTRVIAEDPGLAVGAREQTDRSEAVGMLGGILNHTVTFDTIDALRADYTVLVNNRWTGLYNKLSNDTAKWQPPGSFFPKVMVMQQTFRAFNDALNTLLYANFVLSGHGSPEDPALYFSSVEGFRNETQSFFEIPGFPQILGPKATQAWLAIQNDPHLSDIQTIFTQLAQNAVASGSSVFAGTTNLAAYELAYRYVNPYIDALGSLMHAESLDLTNVTNGARTSASHAFTGEIAFLAALVIVAVLGALLLARAVSRPVRRLASVAGDVQQGIFAVDPIPESGPLELSVASRTFNDMAVMLRSLEAKTVALASEDLTDPVLQEQLPGRAGRAIQHAVDRLTRRVRQREVERQKLREEATRDGLTGLLNRSAVMDVLGLEMRRRRGEGDVVATIFVDLDGLKTINDSYGHDVGDAAIRATGEALTASTRQGDVVARLGGDEFLVVAHVRSEEEATLVADQIARRVSETTVATADGDVRLSCSAGVAMTEQGSQSDPHDLIRAADASMYSVKRRRKGGVDSDGHGPRL